MSPLLETSDYEIAPLLTGFAATYTLTNWSLSMPLTPPAVSLLSPDARNQFRVTLHPGYFTNRNGEHPAAAPAHAMCAQVCGRVRVCVCVCVCVCVRE